MLNNKQYLPFALVAVVASGLGWGASAFMNRETTNAMTSSLAVSPAAAPTANQVALPVQAQTFAPVAVPVNAEALPQATPLVIYREAAAPIVRTVPARTRAAAQPVVTANDNETERPVLSRKKGMNNKTKTAIAIGGGAGVGAAIGGIAGGGKGAAIGALAGAGAGTIYSVIRHKQQKPVF